MCAGYCLPKYHSFSPANSTYPVVLHKSRTHNFLSSYVYILHVRWANNIFCFLFVYIVFNWHNFRFMSLQQFTGSPTFNLYRDHVTPILGQFHRGNIIPLLIKSRGDFLHPFIMYILETRTLYLLLLKILHNIRLLQSCHNFRIRTMSNNPGFFSFPALLLRLPSSLTTTFYTVGLPRSPLPPFLW